MLGKWGVAVVLLVPLSGCHIYRAAARVIIHEPALYFDEKHLEKNLRKDARHAWAEVCRQYPQRTFTDDFVDGFCDGYVDYLDSGGTATIPAVPPFKYRRAKYYTPEGHEQIRQYFLGFKYGMDVAVDTGCRTFLTVPLLLPEVPPPTDPSISVPPSPPATAAPTVPALPLPRPAPDPGKLPGVAPVPADPVKPPDKDKNSPEPVGITIPLPPSESSGPARVFPISAPVEPEIRVPMPDVPRGPQFELPAARPPLAELPPATAYPTRPR